MPVTGASAVVLIAASSGFGLAADRAQSAAGPLVVTNTGTIAHSLQITRPGDSAVLAPGGQGPEISPGQKATMTVRFTVRGSAFYHCGEVEHDEMYGETGYLRVV